MLKDHVKVRLALRSRENVARLAAELGISHDDALNSALEAATLDAVAVRKQQRDAEWLSWTSGREARR